MIAGLQPKRLVDGRQSASVACGVRPMRMNDALLSLTEAIRIARLEDDDQCRGSAEGTIKRLARCYGTKTSTPR
jgi:hypothetical protein